MNCPFCDQVLKLQNGLSEWYYCLTCPSNLELQITQNDKKLIFIYYSDILFDKRTFNMTYAFDNNLLDIDEIFSNRISNIICIEIVLDINSNNYLN